MITYCKLRTGDWGIKGEGLQPGTHVKVYLKSGSVKEEKVGKIIFNKGEFAIATIDKNKGGDSTPVEETKIIRYASSLLIKYEYFNSWKSKIIFIILCNSHSSLSVGSGNNFDAFKSK
jgi:hypothetical protein